MKNILFVSLFTLLSVFSNSLNSQNYTVSNKSYLVDELSSDNLICSELIFKNSSYEKKNVYVYASDITDTWLAASFGVAANGSTALDVSDAGYGVTFTVYVSGLYGKTEVWGYGCSYNL